MAHTPRITRLNIDPVAVLQMLSDGPFEQAEANRLLEEACQALAVSRRETAELRRIIREAEESAKQVMGEDD